MGQQIKSGVHLQQVLTTGHNPIPKGTTVQQRPNVPGTTTNNIYIQSSNVRFGKTSKYIMQQQQQPQHHPNTVYQTSTIVQHPTQPHQQQLTGQTKITNHHYQMPASMQPSPQAQLQHQQQHPPTMHLTTGNSGGTIKYVTSQGTVIAPPNRIRAILQHTPSSQHQQSHQHLQQHSSNTTTYYTTTASTANVVDLGSSVSSESMHSPSAYSNASTSGEELMSDEMSARILQSLSQTKSVFNNNNSNHNNNNTMGRQPLGTVVQQVVAQQHPHQMVKQQISYANNQQQLHHQQQPQQQQQKIVYISNTDFGPAQLINQQQHQQIASQVQFLSRPAPSSTLTPTSVDVTDSVVSANNFLPAYFNVK